MLPNASERLPKPPAMIFPLKRLPYLFVLLVLPLLFAAKNETANDHVLCREGFLKIVSPDPVSVDQGRQVAKLTMAAWKFDLEQMKWKDSIEMEKPLTLRLLSVERMKIEHRGVLGVAWGSNLFAVSTSVLNDPFANGTLAHELGHIQAKRALGKVSEKSLVPRYFIEGHGLSLGRSYRDHLGITNHDYDARKARQIIGLTGKEAKIILTDDNYFRGDRKKEDLMETMGVFFVEYLRVRYHGRGIPDAIARMGRVFELVGQGKTYKSAFKETYGTSVDLVVSEIAAFMERTAPDPAERLEGTRYEGLLKPSPKKKRALSVVLHFMEHSQHVRFLWAGEEDGTPRRAA